MRPGEAAGLMVFGAMLVVAAVLGVAAGLVIRCF